MPIQRSATTAAALSFFLITLNASTVTTALPVIGRDLNAQAGLAWILTGYSLVFALFLLPAGAWADRIGARRAFVAGLALFAATSVVCALALNLTVLLAARAVQGIAAAVILPSGLSMLNAAYPEAPERARAVGRWSAAGAIALVIGSPLGGAITSAIGWQGTFWLTVPPTALALVVALRVPAAPRQSPVRRTSSYRGLVTKPAVVLSSVTGFALNFATYGMIFVVTLYLQQSRGQSAWVSGLVFIPMTLLIVPANLLTGRLTARIGVRRTLLLGQFLMVTGFAGLVFADRVAPVWQLALWLLPAGVGGGLIAPTTTTLMLNGLPPTHSGFGAGLLNAIRQLGSAAAPAVLAPLGFRVSMTVAAVIIVLPAILGRKQCLPSTSPTADSTTRTPAAAGSQS
ncbi:MFS transporter [Kribbella sp. NPDC058245]|uniref:MFS transporter n=1 Tax=Kribbella sp. NPDC058245 TaxID=3346399 RepID=UPI0036F17EF3